METYTLLRQFADSWGLLAMLVFLLAVFAFVLRPGAKDRYRRAAQLPLNDGEER